MKLKNISEVLLSAKKIGITYHVSPDGDAVGSVLALLQGLRYLNKEAYVISKDYLSENLRYLPCADMITGNIIEPTPDTDVVIVLDCGNLERVCADLSNFTGVVLNVDHHLSNDNYGKYNYVDTNAAATAEIVYELLNLLGIDFTSNDKKILDIATCIYTSLVTDTGCFRHSNVTYKTLEIASVLKKLGVNNTYIYQSLFDNKEFDRVRFIGKVISNMKLELDNKVALIELPKSFGQEFGIEIGDTSDIISYGLQIKGVEVTLLIKEVDNGVKCSLRSKNDIDVRKIAEVFGGGGHIKAAGISLKEISMIEAKEKLLNQIEKEL